MVRATFAALCLVTVCAQAAAPERFLVRQPLPSGETVVVAEGDFEAHSLGSYSIRVYAPAQGREATGFFTSGLVLPRDGAVDRVMLDDVDDDGEAEVVVVVRSTGAGGLLSAQVFEVDGGQVAPLVSLSDLVSEADLRDALHARAKLREGIRARQADRLKK